MPRTSTKAATTESDAPLFDEWLSIEEAYDCPGYVLPERAAVVDWCVHHAGPVLTAAVLAFLVPLLALFGGR
jgi:hypothetical protein